MSPDKHSQHSTGDTVAIIVFTVVVLGLLAMIGCTKAPSIRASSQDKAVAGNLRMLSNGADEYYQANGVTSVASATLVGTNPSQYVKTFATVANETYPRVLMSGSAVTASGIAGARTVTFGG